MKQYGLFDDKIAYDRLDKCLDPLLCLNEAVNWELFRVQLRSVRKNETVGRPSFDVIMMFKVMILQSLYNISDAAAEFFIGDRLSFMRFLGLDLTEKVFSCSLINIKIGRGGFFFVSDHIRIFVGDILD
ncbi:MAG: transposase [Synergistaceae bacterium]|nr:transposase [Synergistaceae bacterium]